MEFKYNGNSKQSGIYKITNKVNNRFYYGSCKSFQQRFGQHKSSLLKNKHQNKFFQADFNKCLEEMNNDDFLLFEVIEIVEGSKEMRLKIEEEKYLKPSFDSGKECYNLINKATSPEGYKLKNPEETKKKMSILRKEMWQDPKHKEKLKKSMEKYLPQQKENLDKYRKIAQEKSAQVRQKYYGKILDPNGKVFEITNLQQFCKERNLNRANMQKVIFGVYPSYKGWRKWKEELENVQYISNQSHNQKSFSIFAPDRTLYSGNNITQFCLKHNLRKENITAVLNGRRKSHLGWKIV